MNFEREEYNQQNLLKKIRNYEKLINSLKLEIYFPNLLNVDTNFLIDKLNRCEYLTDDSYLNDYYNINYKRLLDRWQYYHDEIAKSYIPEFIINNMPEELAEEARKANKMIEEKKSIFLKEDIDK